MLDIDRLKCYYIQPFLKIVGDYKLVNSDPFICYMKNNDELTGWSYDSRSNYLDMAGELWYKLSQIYYHSVLVPWRHLEAREIMKYLFKQYMGVKINELV